MRMIWWFGIDGEVCHCKVMCLYGNHLDWHNDAGNTYGALPKLDNSPLNIDHPKNIPRLKKKKTLLQFSTVNKPHNLKKPEGPGL